MLRGARRPLGDIESFIASTDFSPAPCPNPDVSLPPFDRYRIFASL